VAASSGERRQEAVLLAAERAQGAEGVAAEQRLGRGANARGDGLNGRGGELGPEARGERRKRGRPEAGREWIGPRRKRVGLPEVGPGRGFGFLVLGLGWVSFLLLLLFLFLFKLTQSNLFEFKIEFEFNSNTQTNKSMLQHECNIKSKPRKNFNYLRNKILD